MGKHLFYNQKKLNASKRNYFVSKILDSTSMKRQHPKDLLGLNKWLIAFVFES